MLSPTHNRRARAVYIKRYDDDGNVDTFPADPEQYILDETLQHGDVVSFDDYRDEETFIVNKNNEGRFIWTKNTDPYMTGYLHIPEEIVLPLQDVLNYYADVIKETKSMTLSMNPSDRLIMNLWDKVPLSFRFEVWCEDGEPIDLHLRLPQEDDWISLGSIKELKRDSIKEYLK